MPSAQGKYKGIRFRSLLELSFLIFLEEDGVQDWEIYAEPLRVPYRIGKGKQRRYVPDFLVRGMYYEVKLSRRVKTRMNDAKFAAMEQFCVTEGGQFQVVTEKDFPQLSLQKILERIDSKDIEWSKGTMNRRRFGSKIRKAKKK